MQWDRVWSTSMGQNAKASPRASAKASLLEEPEGTWQTPSVSLPSTVVSPALAVKIRLSGFAVALFIL